MTTSDSHHKLSAVQLHLLRFFSERPVSDSDTADIQRIIANYYAQKADERIDEIWKERGYTAEAMDEILNAPLKKSTDASGN